MGSFWSLKHVKCVRFAKTNIWVQSPRCAGLDSTRLCSWSQILGPCWGTPKYFMRQAEAHTWSLAQNGHLCGFDMLVCRCHASACCHWWTKRVIACNTAALSGQHAAACANCCSETEFICHTLCNTCDAEVNAAAICHGLFRSLHQLTCVTLDRTNV